MQEALFSAVVGGGAYKYQATLRNNIAVSDGK